MKMQSQKQEQTQTKIIKPYEPMHAVVCNRNGITIYYDAIDSYTGKIVKNDNGVLKVGSKIYKDQSQKLSKNDLKYWKVIEKLYTQEYYKLPEGLRELRAIEVELEILLVRSRSRKPAALKLGGGDMLDEIVNK